MSYAESRTKLANLLIKAGYNKAKSLKAVRYPYLESLQLIHNTTFWDSRTESVKEYQEKDDIYVETEENGYSTTNDKLYNILGDIQKARAYLKIGSSAVSDWQNSGYRGTYFYSYPLQIIAKYRHKYPKDEEVDSLKTTDNYIEGYAESAGDYGHQETELPLPEGGWLKVELSTDD